MFQGSRSKFLLVGLSATLLSVILLVSLLRPLGQAGSVRYQLRKGLSVREVARELHAVGLIRNPRVFLIWGKILGAKTLRPGVYELSRKSSSFTLYRELQKGPPLVRITFPEGWMAKQMAALLETYGVTNAKEFMVLVEKEKREGYLFPDTYFFEQGTPAPRVVARLVEQFKKKEPKDMSERAKAMKLTPEQLVTLASIIEKEAQVPAERPLIAGVFYNRLRKHWYLESCATVEYALGAWKPRLRYKDLNVSSPYNTYRHPGLPPGPICNPGAAALDAAAHPAQTEMMFFVADRGGTHQFSRYYKEHLAAQRSRRGKGEGRPVK